MFSNLATGRFSRKFFPEIAGSGHAGSNDTGLKSVSRPGAEPIDCQTERQRDRQNTGNIIKIVGPFNER